MRLSVIIPTLSREKQLFNTLECLSSQDLSRSEWECIIVAQSEIDISKIQQIADQNTLNFVVFHSGLPNASLARNIGLQEAKGEIVLFIDDDMIIEDKQFFSKHLRHYVDNKACGVVGKVTDVSKEERSQRHKWSYKKRVGWLYFPNNFNKPTLVFNGISCNLSVRKEFAIKAGGMDANFIKGAHREESDFCLRLTKKYGPLIYDPEMSVIHLGTLSGGCRTWGMNSGIHPLHHISGEWYFILNGLKHRTIFLLDLHHHIAVLIKRQILNEGNGNNIIFISLAIFKSILGLILILPKIFSKPKTLNNFTLNKYQLIYTSHK
jgi:glycosyltransferase involved in cell wall biosynthesis